MHWEPEAEEILKRAPRLIRAFARGRVEALARERGSDRVTKELAQQAYAALRPGGGGGAGSEPDPAEVERLERSLQSEERGKRQTRCYEVTACAGSVGCPLALISVAEVADALVEEIQSSGLPEHLAAGRAGRPILAHHRFKAAVAGCPNACSQPQICDLGVVGAARVAVTSDRCDQCGACVAACREGCLDLAGKAPDIAAERCIGCGECVRACPRDALQIGDVAHRVLAGGKLGRHPRLATEVRSFAAAEEVRRVARRALKLLMEEGDPGERLGSLLARKGSTESKLRG
jgi:dissimilatory sulfite reductase (desulfoviridin) alpha/beta subunit